MSYNYLTEARRKVFVSYHHRNDQYYYNEFSRVFHNGYELISDTSLERQIDSADANYVMRRIRESHLSGSSCTIVLCGAATPRRKYVDWEILASLGQQMGIVAVGLPTIEAYPNGGTAKPLRLQDNIDSGYAQWTNWATLVARPDALAASIERALSCSKRLIVNSRNRMEING